MSVKVFTSDNFETEVLGSDKTVLVDFYADWCGPCKMIAPIVEEIAKENPDIVVGKVNVDNDQQLAIAFNIVSIPFLAIIKNGEVVDQIVGYRTKDEILRALGK